MEVEQLLGRALSRNIDRNIDAFIEKRHQQRVREDGRDRAEEELWAESERRYFAHRAEQRDADLLAFHEGQIARLGTVMESLIDRHKEQAERLRNRLEAS